MKYIPGQPIPAGYTLIITPYVYNRWLKRRIWARDYGKKAFVFLVRTSRRRKKNP